ncbi:hypothetical protein [Pseudomonas fluorescens]|uniref:hypothetical protein n=1 Tax=Pseudomonas fluorescens TaxID=294 RepID=UPI00177BA606|nr:hypothetical protein [Pseudomonas fluorescens]
MPAPSRASPAPTGFVLVVNWAAAVRAKSGTGEIGDGEIGDGFISRNRGRIYFGKSGTDLFALKTVGIFTFPFIGFAIFCGPAWLSIYYSTPCDVFYLVYNTTGTDLFAYQVGGGFLPFLSFSLRFFFAGLPCFRLIIRRPVMCSISSTKRQVPVNCPR